MSTNVASFGSGGGGGGGPGGIEYTGPSSGGGGSGYSKPGSFMGGGSGGLQYESSNGITIDMTFYNRYSDYKQQPMESVNRGMMPEQTHREKEAEAKKETNWIEKTIAIGGMIGLIPTPATQIIGGISLIADALYSGYKFYKGGSGSQLLTDLGWLAVPRIIRKGARTIGVKHYRAIRDSIHEYAEAVEAISYSTELHRNAYVAGKD